MPKRAPRLVAALAALAGLISAEEPATEPLVTTAFEVRQEAQAVITDLRQGVSAAERPALIERVQALLAAHADALVATSSGFTPLSEVIAAELATAGLATAFNDTYAGPAQRRLEDLRSTGGDNAAWRALALAYPGTPAAHLAWQHLADRAWDLGLLGAFLAVADHAGAADDAQHNARIAAARDLLGLRHALTLPPSLDLQEMWRLDLPTRGDAPMQARRGMAKGTARSFVLSAPADDLTAASDGLGFFVIDHLVGRRVGEMHALGAMAIPAVTCRPAAGRDSFVALGVERSGQAMLTCLDRQGRLSWRTSLGEGNYSGLSAPLIIDDLAVVAILVSRNEAPELRVLAFRLKDGEKAWDSFVAKLPLMLGRAQFFDESNAPTTPPLLAAHAGGILVLPNTGLLAKVDTFGGVRRIWSYPSNASRLEARLGRERDAGRAGGLASDGGTAVATPADAEGLVWVLDANDREPRKYTGDGSRGQVIDVCDGLALLAGRQTTLVDCTALTARWQHAGVVELPSGAIGNHQVLVAGQERLTLLSRDDGSVVSDRGAEPPAAFAISSGLVLVAGRESLLALGDTAAFIAEQQAAAARNPQDYRPLVALGKLWAAQGKTRQAYDHLLEGLLRGAPSEYAATAARLVREDLELSVDIPERFSEALARLDRLAPHFPGLAGEVAFWKGRRAEQAGDRSATKLYKTALAAPPMRIQLGRGREGELEILIQAMAEAGLARLAGHDALPPWAQTKPAGAPPSFIAAWQIATSRARTCQVAGGLVVGYEGGALAARRLSDGGEAWRRLPDQRLLGVKLTADNAGNDAGLRVDVLEGTAAAAAGLRTGDRITAFNELPIRDFHRDLIPAVAGAAVDAPFTITVLRDGGPLALRGRLGGELVEPVAINASTVLVWPVFPVRGKRGQGEGLWLAAHDLASGTELWRGALPPATSETAAPRPLLMADDVVVTVDGNDLIAIALREPGEPRERWRVPDGASWLDGVRLVGPTTALLSDPVHGQVRLLDLTTGTLIATLPADATVTGIVDRTDLVVRATDGRLSCFDLGRGRLAWQSEKPCARPLAASGDAVFALNDRRQLVVLDRANGTIRRTLGEWTTVEDTLLLSDRMYLIVRRSDTARSVVAVGLPGGGIMWERSLPRGTEIREWHANSGGLVAVLGEQPQRPSLLGLDPTGQVVIARVLNDGESVLPLSGGALIAGIQGLAALPIGIDVPPPLPLPAPTVAMQTSLLLTAQQALPLLDWQSVGQAAYAVARCERSLLVFARLPPEVELLEVRVGDGASPIDGSGQVLTFQRHRVGRFNDLPDGWRMNGSQKLSSENNVWTCIARLEPPLTVVPAPQPLLRAVVAASATDDDLVPGWLRRGWRPVIDPLPAPAP